MELTTINITLVNESKINDQFISNKSEIIQGLIFKKTDEPQRFTSKKIINEITKLNKIKDDDRTLAP